MGMGWHLKDLQPLLPATLTNHPSITFATQYFSFPFGAPTMWASPCYALRGPHHVGNSSYKSFVPLQQFFPPPALTFCLSPSVTCVSLWSALLCLLLLTKVTLVCQEVSAHHVKRDTSLGLGTQLTRLSVHSGLHWIKSLVAFTPFAP